jgi:hypothetical protein
LKSEEHEREKATNKQRIRERYVMVKEVLRTHPEYETHFEALPFNSGYFMCLKLKGLDPDKVWGRLLNNYSTGVICYSEKSLLRIAFASTPKTKIEKLFANIHTACQDCTRSPS